MKYVRVTTHVDFTLGIPDDDYKPGQEARTEDELAGALVEFFALEDEDNVTIHDVAVTVREVQDANGDA